MSLFLFTVSFVKVCHYIVVSLFVNACRQTNISCKKAMVNVVICFLNPGIDAEDGMINHMQLNSPPWRLR